MHSPRRNEDFCGASALRALFLEQELPFANSLPDYGLTTVVGFDSLNL
ncbi:MAG: hypothetical protein JWN14_1028 [Chthonomonadales bacterium]|nr:hypothetical protein [Chthonomonadales bacterium]